MEPIVFTQRDIERHKQRTREVSHLYLNSNLYNMETSLNTAVETLLDMLSAFVDTDQPVELFQ